MKTESWIDKLRTVENRSNLDQTILILKLIQDVGRLKLSCPIQSRREETGIQYKAGKTQACGNQPSKLAWPNQVDDEWKKFMYKSVLDRKQKNYPVKITNLLMDASDQNLETNGKWLSFLKFGDEWNM